MKDEKLNLERVSKYFDFSEYELQVDYPAFRNRYIEKEALESVLSWIAENGLKEYEEDLLLIAMKLHFTAIFPFYQIAVRRTYKAYRKELKDSISLIDSSKESDIQIIIKNKAFNNHVIITNDFIIEDIIKTLKKRAKKLSKKDSIKDIPKGRKPKYHNLGFIVHILQSYLQEFTPLKAEEGISISNPQARFIYYFLFRFGKIPLPEAPLFYEDTIRNYLRNYRNVKG